MIFQQIEERIDITSATGELIFHAFGAIAHFERGLISKRTKDGIQAARMKGKNGGDLPSIQKPVLALQNLVQAGRTAGQAAKQLGIARSTAYRLIKETAET
ncbi:recombinase family protein [Planktotalea arctica]|uniref:recombinase family protein n=1 Tax=Planktotalea arctica TaxID=1481893 RepID=UPI000A1743F0|nr:recombinase family protein [Planktotalea arctica]